MAHSRGGEVEGERQRKGGDGAESADVEGCKAGGLRKGEGRWFCAGKGEERWERLGGEGVGDALGDGMKGLVLASGANEWWPSEGRMDGWVEETHRKQAEGDGADEFAQRNR